MVVTSTQGPKEANEMSLNERIFVGAVENISNDVFRGVEEEQDDGAYADDDPKDYADLEGE